MVELPRELMESCCAAAQEATMQGFDDSVLSAVFGDPKHRRLLETVYRMGFESGWRIRERQTALGVTDAPAASPTILNVGFTYENLVHTPTVLLGFRDWDTRDAFVKALAAGVAGTPQEKQS